MSELIINEPIIIFLSYNSGFKNKHSKLKISLECELKKVSVRLIFDDFFGDQSLRGVDHHQVPAGPEVWDIDLHLIISNFVLVY